MVYWFGASESDGIEISINTTSGKLSKLYSLFAVSWRTEPPNEEGWYWVLRENGDIDIENVYDNQGILCISDGYYGDVHTPVTKQEYFTHWLGPLPMPLVPPE